MCNNIGTNGLFGMLSALIKCVSVCAVRRDHHIMTERGSPSILWIFFFKSYSDLFSLH